MNRVDERFASMGSEGRVRLESATAGRRELTALAAGVRSTLADAERRLTRFDPRSDLSRLNADPRTAVPVAPLLARLVVAAVWAGERSGGLVDATLLGELEREGYGVSRTGLAPASLAEALAAAPARRPARPRALPGFRSLRVLERGRVVRPPTVRIDSGGLGKGLAADAAVAALPPTVRFAISCGGDLALGPAGVRWEVAVPSAFSGDEAHRLAVRGPAGVATSGIHMRLWRRDDGGFAHHLLDPATGRAAWTGLVAVTAVAESALGAEVLAKTALLSGPEAARALLRVRGGVLQHDDGRIEVVEPPPVVRLPRAFARPLGSAA